MRKASRHNGNLPSSHLTLIDIFKVSVSGLRTRKLRSALSALGITIGIAAVVGVLGLSASGNADLIRELDSLGTNLLTIEAGQGFGAEEASLPDGAAAMLRRITPVYEVSSVTRISGQVFRNNLIEDGRTKGITIIASDLNLLQSQRGSMQNGYFLNELNSTYPVVVLGSVAAERLGIQDTTDSKLLWIGQEWFSLIGIMNPLPLAADLDRAAIIGYGAAEEYFGHDGQVDTIYVRAYPEHVEDVRSVMPATVNPENPEEVQVSRASDVLEARAVANSTFTNLFMGLGAVALLVGGIGIANVMVIAVIERRSEIGLRRAIGATKLHIGVQFITESLLLACVGGAMGIIVGMIVTAVYASTQGWYIVIPQSAIYIGIGSSVLIGGVAGFYPAMRAANMSPTEALRSN
ncbi:MAG: ABC transporter permease [SAR202 cluster bacterium]|nr:ABC transporter permease [SAR202 cluster bacterium]